MRSFLSGVLSATLVAASEGGPRDLTAYTFEAFLLEFGKAHSNGDVELRRDLFATNVARILEHNEGYTRGDHSWWMDVNQFTDLTEQEFLNHLGKKGARLPGTRSSMRTLSARELPSSVDWRGKDVLTPVKNQGSCGSCWAFASIETVESAYAQATGKLETLAPQAYVSCSTNPNSCGGTGGCGGSVAELAFNYTVEHGVPLESNYPYTASNTACQTFQPAVRVSGYEVVTPNDADALATAVATVGPMAISVAASQWSSYGGGVFTGCTGQTGAVVNHLVQLVGYSSDYWLIRNSWGSTWGEAGFMKVSRSKDDTFATDVAPLDGFGCTGGPSTIEIAGECGILSDTAYPIGAGPAESVVQI